MTVPASAIDAKPACSIVANALASWALFSQRLAWANGFACRVGCPGREVADAPDGMATFISTNPPRGMRRSNQPKFLMHFPSRRRQRLVACAGHSVVDSLVDERLALLALHRTHGSVQRCPAIDRARVPTEVATRWGAAPRFAIARLSPSEGCQRLLCSGRAAIGHCLKSSPPRRGLMTPGQSSRDVSHESRTWILEGRERPQKKELGADNKRILVPQRRGDGYVGNGK